MAQPQTSSYQFSEHLFMFAAKHWKKGIPLDDDIVGCKNSIAFKYIAKSRGFFLLGAPKYLLAAKFFYSLFAQRSGLPLVIRGRSGAPATSKMERFEIIVNGLDGALWDNS